MEALYNPKSTGPRAPPDSSKSSISKDGFGSSGSFSANSRGIGGGGGRSTSSNSTSSATTTTRVSSTGGGGGGGGGMGQYYYTETTSASGMKMWGMGSGPAKCAFSTRVKAQQNQEKSGEFTVDCVLLSVVLLCACAVCCTSRSLSWLSVAFCWL